MPSITNAAVTAAAQAVGGTVRGEFKGSKFAITYPNRGDQDGNTTGLLTAALTDGLPGLDRLAFQLDSRLEYGPETGAGVLEITFYLPGWDVTE